LSSPKESTSNAFFFYCTFSVLRAAKRPKSELASFASQFAPIDDGGEIQSSHALNVLASIWGDEDGKKMDAKKALDLLAEKYDPIRANYWNYRKSLILGPDALAT
jgi:protein farnesyltransferase/geranylgeranyltransferase type-1 subunit alpha